MLSSNIKKYRKQKGLSQEGLAEKMDVSRQAVSKWENNLSEPSTKKLLTLAELFDIDVDVLINGEEKNEPSPASAAEQKEKKKRQKNRLVNLTIIGYIFIGITVNGLYGYYFPNEDAMYWQWLITALIGGCLLGYKNYRLPMEKKLRASGLDVLYIFLLFVIANLPLPNGLSLILVAVVGGALVVPLLRYSLNPWQKKNQ